MDFNPNQPIWLQIYDLMCRRIASGEYPAEGRLPSLRDLAVELQVNPNTCLRVYNRLEQEGMVYNRRGIGYFVAERAGKRVDELWREEFIQNEVPQFFERMDQAGLSLEELARLYQNRKK